VSVSCVGAVAQSLIASRVLVLAAKVDGVPALEIRGLERRKGDGIRPLVVDEILDGNRFGRRIARRVMPA